MEFTIQQEAVMAFENVYEEVKGYFDPSERAHLHYALSKLTDHFLNSIKERVAHEHQ